MSETASISSGIAARYATAMFDLASETGALEALETDITAMEGALAESAELRDVIHSPVYSREETESAMGAVAAAMNLSPMIANTMRLMAQKRRLFVLPALLTELRSRIADHKGEVTVDVASAKALSSGQLNRLVGVLNKATGKDVTVNATVDASLIGGLVVKVGSKMIDTSIRSKLNALQNSMKEVG